MVQWIGRSLLGLSWLVVFWVFLILTEFVLVPWDTAPERPAVGSLARSFNDFFETPPGSLLPGLVLVLLSIYLTLRRPAGAYIRRAALNLGFALLLFALSNLAFLVNNRVFPYPPVLYDPTFRGYHRSVIPGLTILALCAVWLWWQARANGQLRRNITGT